MKKWTGINRFFKGQQPDLSPELQSENSYTELRNGRLIDDGEENQSVQNFKGDVNAIAHENLNGTSDIIEFREANSLSKGNAVNFTMTIAFDNESFTVDFDFVYEDELLAYEEIAKAIEAALDTDSKKRLKVAYNNTKVVIWYNQPEGVNDAVTLDATYSFTGLIKRKRFTSRSNYRIIKSVELPNELIIVAIANEGHLDVPEASATITPGGGGVGFGDLASSFQTVYNTPTEANIVAIWSIEVDYNGYWVGQTLKYCDILNYKLNKILDVESSFENEKISKLYLTDGYNPFSSINLHDPNLMAIDPSDLEVFPEVKFSAPILKKITDSGRLPVCTIQYGYTLISQNGASSVLSPISQIIPIGNYQSGEHTKGGTSDEITSKAITIEISDVDTDFNRIRIYALYSIGGRAIDRVEIISEQEITSSVIEVVHTGTERAIEVPYESLLSSNNGFKYAKHVESAENRLFAANLNVDTPNLDNWNTIVKSANYIGEVYESKYNPDPTAYMYLPSQKTNGFDSNSQRIFGGKTPGYNSGNGVQVTFVVKEIPIEDYSIGEVADIYNTSFKGNWDANTGYLNRELVFHNGRYWKAIRDNNNVEPNYSNDLDWSPNNFYETVSKFNFGIGTNSEITEYLEYYPKNKSPLYYGNDKANFNSPHFHHRLAGYMPGDVIRLGLLPRDNQGNAMFVKYIGDLKVPDFNNAYYKLNHLSDNHNDLGISNNYFTRDFRPFVTKEVNGIAVTYARVVLLDISVCIPKEIREQLSGYEIVRSVITENDKTVLGVGPLWQTNYYSNAGLNLSSNNSQGKPGNMNEVHGNSVFPHEQMDIVINRPPVPNRTLFTVDVVDAMAKLRDFNSEQNLEMKFVQELPLHGGQLIRNINNSNTGENHLGYMHSFSAGPIVSMNSAHPTKNTPVNLLRTVNVDVNELVPKQIIKSPSTDYRNSAMRNLNPSAQSAAGINKLENNPSLLIRTKEDFDLGLDRSGMLTSLVAIKRKNHTPYGGANEFAIKSTQWISCGHYTRITSPKHAHIVGGGDTYWGMHVYSKDYQENTWQRPSLRTSMHGVNLPTLGNFNWNFMHGIKAFDSSYRFQVKESFEINPVYLKDNRYRVFVSDNENFSNQRAQPYMISVSPQKINGALIDQWLKFPVFDQYEMPNKFDAITDLVSVNDKLYVVQGRAVSLLAIDPKALIQAEETDILIGNGTGRVIADHQVIGYHGSYHKSSIVKFNEGFVFLDSINRALIMVVGNQMINLSEQKNHQDYFRKLFDSIKHDKPLAGKGFAGYIDPVYNEIVLTIIEQS